MVRMDEMVNENPEMESLCAVLSNLVVSNSATPWTVAHQAPLSMKFSRQEYWSGLLLLLLLSRFSHVRLCATPETAAQSGSAIPGILQARTLERVAMPYSKGTS